MVENALAGFAGKYTSNIEQVKSMISKQRKSPHFSRFTKISHIFDVLHADIWGTLISIKYSRTSTG